MRLISLLFILISSSTLAQGYVVFQYTETSGLASSNVSSVVQTGNGNLWFTTPKGISEYDGYNWNMHSSKNGLITNEYKFLKVDLNGCIWAAMGGEKIVVSTFNGNRWLNFTDPNNLDVFTVTSFDIHCAENDTIIVIGTLTKGLVICKNGKWSVNNDVFDYNDIRIISVKKFQKEFYIGTNHGLYILRQDMKIDRPVRVDSLTNTNRIFESKEIFDIKTIADTVYLLGLDFIARTYDSKFEKVASFPRLEDQPAGSRFVLIPDYYGTFIVGGPRSIIQIFPVDGSIKEINDKVGLLSSGCTDIYLDEEKILWIATVFGVNKLPSMRFENYGTEQGLLRNDVTSIIERSKDDFILGHINGFSFINNGRISNNIFSKPDMPAFEVNRILDMEIDSKKNIYAAAEHKGIIKLSPDNELELLNNTGEAVSLVIAGGHFAYVAFPESIVKYDLSNRRGITIKKITRSEGFFRKLFWSPENKLYCATGKQGVYVFKNDSLISVYKSTYNRANSIYSIFFDAQITFAGTLDGLYFLDSDSLKKFFNEDFSIERPVYFIGKDIHKNFWFGTDNGIIKWDGIRSDGYTTNHGLSGLETNRDAFCVDANGNVWIGTVSGLSIYRREFENLRDLQPEIKISAIELNGLPVIDDESFAFEFGNTSLRFQLRTNSFINERFNNFTVKLDGYDSDWVTLWASHQIRYTNLLPGEYIFRARVQNALGIWSEEIESPLITVVTPLYMQWWFYVILFVALGVFFYWVYYFISRTKYSFVLEGLVNQKDKALKESELKYRQMFEENKAVMLVFDPHRLIILDANKSAENFYGFSRANLVNSEIGAIDIKYNPEIFKRNIYRNQMLVSRHKLANGLLRDVEIVGSEINIAGNPLIYLIVNDITDRIQAEKALRESEERYRTLLGNIQDGVFVIQDEKILYANQSFADTLGYLKDVIIGMHINELIAPEDKDFVVGRHKERMLGLDVESEYEFKLMRKGDKKRLIVNMNVGVITLNGRKAALGTIKDITEKKFSEEQLRNLSLAVEQSQVGVVITDVNGNIDYANQKFCEMNEYAKDELIGKNPRILKSGKTDESIYHLLWSTLVAGKIWKGEFCNKRKNGGFYWVETVISPVKNELGRITHYLAVENDISFQKYAIEELRKNEELLNTILHSVPVMIFALDTEGKIKIVRGKVLEMLGYDERKVVGKLSFDLFKRTPEVIFDLKKSLTGQKFSSVRKLMRKIFEATYSPIFVDGKFEGVLGIVFDVTDRYKSEIAVKESEAKIRALLNAIPDIMFEFSRNGVCLNCHNVNLMDTGDSKDAVIGKHINDLFPKRIAEETLESIRESIRTKNIVIFEYRVLQEKSKSKTPIESRGVHRTLRDSNESKTSFQEESSTESSVARLRRVCRTLRDSGEKFYEMRVTYAEPNMALAIIRDISDQKEYQNSLIRSKEEAEKSDKLKTEFLAQMSHEIRTPINSILSFSSLLREEFGTGVSEELKEAFNVIEDGGRRLTRTIDLVLNMAQLQTGNYLPNLKPVDLDKDILEPLVGELLPQALRKGLKLNYSVHSLHTKIIGDDYTLGQMFVNLVENAIKYTPRGTVDIILNDVNGKLHVFVKDTGIVISNEYMPRMFEAFSQETTGYSRRFEGNGLGLALVKKYVEINDAEIEVESTKGIGTQFVVKFKIAG